VVQGEFDLHGAHYACTQKVHVRAPGIRAELCWDTVGGDPPATGAGNDLDLHFARLQGIASCTSGGFGWDTSCAVGSGGSTTYPQDCYWDPSVSMCGYTTTIAPNWGYSTSANSACQGWSSKRAALPCTNPRLDRDLITCDPSVDDPVAVTGTGGAFCAPENINLDNPNDGDTFVIGVYHYRHHGTTGTTNARPHVNVYCNGVRVLSAGTNPLTGQTSSPLLITTLSNLAKYSPIGDLWTVGTVKAHVSGGQLTSCDLGMVPPHYPDPTRDGANGTQLCVDSTQNSTPGPNQYSYVNHQFVDHTSLQGVANGSIPVTAAEWCKH
jgi:hypothetical protein